MQRNGNARHMRQLGLPYQMGGPANALAAKGRGGDTKIAHLTPGEIVIPRAVAARLPPNVLADAFKASGVDPGQYTVGGNDDSINPRTGMREFKYGADTSEGGATGFDGGQTRDGRSTAFGGAYGGAWEDSSEGKEGWSYSPPSTGTFSAGTTTRDVAIAADQAAADLSRDRDVADRFAETFGGGFLVDPVVTSPVAGDIDASWPTTYDVAGAQSDAQAVEAARQSLVGGDGAAPPPAAPTPTDIATQFTDTFGGGFLTDPVNNGLLGNPRGQDAGFAGGGSVPDGGGRLTMDDLRSLLDQYLASQPPAVQPQPFPFMPGGGPAQMTPNFMPNIAPPPSPMAQGKPRNLNDLYAMYGAPQTAPFGFTPGGG